MPWTQKSKCYYCGHQQSEGLVFCDDCGKAELYPNPAATEEVQAAVKEAIRVHGTATHEIDKLALDILIALGYNTWTE